MSPAPLRRFVPDKISETRAPGLRLARLEPSIRAGAAPTNWSSRGTLVSMTAAINVSSMANWLLFEDLPFDPARLGFHELAPEQEDYDDREKQINGGERGEWYD